MRLAHLLPILLCAVAPIAHAQTAVLPADSTIRRGDRTIFHEHHPSEREWGYAQAIIVGTTIYVSGTIGGGETMEQQVTQIYRRIARTLKKHGATLQDVVRETVYTKDVEALAAANGARKAAYAGHTPAATWVQISRLLAPTALVEIEVTAIVPPAAGK